MSKRKSRAFSAGKLCDSMARSLRKIMEMGSKVTALPTNDYDQIHKALSDRPNKRYGCWEIEDSDLIYRTTVKGNEATIKLRRVGGPL